MDSQSAFRVINPQISATIGVAKQALRHAFVVVDAKHGENYARHHRENAEQGVAGLAHSLLRRSIQSARGVAQGLPDRTSHTRFLSEGTAR